MPARNVIPHPLQKPHPGVGGLHPAVVGQHGRRKAIGALSFAYTGPGPLKDRVDTYYKGLRGEGIAGHPGDQPQHPGHRRRPVHDGGPYGRGGDQTARCRRRLLLLRHHALLPDRDAHPGRTKVWELYEQAVRRTPPWPTAPAVAPSARPTRCGSSAGLRGQRRRRDHPAAQPRPTRASWVDRDHGLRILPEFIERDEKRPWRPGKRLEPVIEKVEARRRPSESTVVRRHLRVRRAAHRAGRQVHRLGDSGGVGRDQRGRVQAAQAEGCACA